MYWLPRSDRLIMARKKVTLNTESTQLATSDPARGAPEKVNNREILKAVVGMVAIFYLVSVTFTVNMGFIWRAWEAGLILVAIVLALATRKERV